MALAGLRVEALDAATIADALRLLAERPVDVIVSRWNEPAFDRVQATQRGVRCLHVGALRGALVEAVGQGFAVEQVDDGALASRIERMLAEPRVGARRVRDDLTLSFRGARHRVCDFSNDGIAFSVGFATTPPLPGDVLEDVTVQASGRDALAGATLVVRNVAVGEKAYRVGCALRPPRAAADVSAGEIVDRALIAGLVCRTLAGDGFTLELAAGDGIDRVAGGSVDAAAGEIALGKLDATLAPFDVVTCRFELGGSGYCFTTSVVRGEPLVLRLPRVVSRTRHRTAARYRPSADHPVAVELEAALLPQPIVRAVRDIGGSGFAFALAAHDVLPPGMLLDRVVLRVGEHAFACRGIVRTISRGSDGLRCGVELRDVDEVDRIRLADLLMRTRFPSIDDAGKLSFDELWSFFLASKFVYPEKATTLLPLMPAIRDTFDKLARHPNTVAKPVVYKEGDEVVGYLSILRGWSDSWLAQHLQSLPGRLGGVQLSVLAGEFMEPNIDLGCFKVFYRPENGWPERVFGGFARKVNEPQLLDLRTFAYYKLDGDAALPDDGKLDVVEAVGDDLALVERYFIDAEPSGLLLRSDDLTAELLTLRHVDQMLAPLGLTRRRRVLLALDHGRPVGFALAELSSPGLNLSELLSAFRPFVFPGEDPLPVYAALLRACRALYARAERPFAIGLLPAEEVPSLARLGLQPVKHYACWTCRRELAPLFFDHINGLVASVMRPRHSAAL